METLADASSSMMNANVHNVAMSVAASKAKRKPFSEEEDLIIIAAHKRFGCRWVKMGEMLPLRTDTDVKNRWNSSMRRVYRNIYSGGVEKRKKAAMKEVLYRYCLKMRSTLGITASERKFKEGLMRARSMREAKRTKYLMETQSGARQAVSQNKRKRPKAADSPSSVRYSSSSNMNPVPYGPRAVSRENSKRVKNNNANEMPQTLMAPPVAYPVFMPPFVTPMPMPVLQNPQNNKNQQQTANMHQQQQQQQQQLAMWRAQCAAMMYATHPMMQQQNPFMAQQQMMQWSMMHPAFAMQQQVLMQNQQAAASMSRSVSPLSAEQRQKKRRMSLPN